MAWKIVLCPNYDAPEDERGQGVKVVPRDFERRESAVAVEQGIAAAGKWWGKVVPAEEVDATVRMFKGR